MKRQGSVIIGILLVILIAIFSVMNTTAVPIHFGFTVVTWPLVLILLVAVFLGALLMFLFATLTSVQAKRDAKKQAAELASLQAENARLKRQLTPIDAEVTPVDSDDKEAQP